MADNENAVPPEKISVIKNGEEIVMDKKTFDEGVSSGKLKVTEGADGKQHILERMNG